MIDVVTRFRETLKNRLWGRHRVEFRRSGGTKDGAMQRQGSFSQAEYAGKKKQTRRDKFLAEMEQVVPWARLVDRLRPFYPKGERGRPPVGLERMLRLYFLQQWYGLADEALEDALYDSQALRGFAGIDLVGGGGSGRDDGAELPPLAGASTT